MTLDPLAFRRLEKGEPYGRYVLEVPPLGEAEENLLKILRDVLRSKTSLSHAGLDFLGDKKDDFISLVRDSIKRIKPKKLYSPEELLEIAKDFHEDLSVLGVENPYVPLKAVYDGLGLGDLEFLIYDKELEDIMVNGYDEPVFVYHYRLGYMVTNVVFGRELREIVGKIARYLNIRDDVIDGHLPDGSRVSVVGESLAGRGPAVTVRKFGRGRMNLLDILRSGTMSVELASYLWLAVDGMGTRPSNIIVSGNTGGGKTTTLNALLDLVPEDERIITIEDTRELRLHHRNWVALSNEGTSVSLNDLLVAALRMRPDRIVVGEVRGSEAETLLAAMNVGHRGMGTLHANSARDTLRRLTSPPMSVPRDMLRVLDVLVVQHRVKLPGRGTLRRVVEVVEISSIEGGVSITPVFEWDPSKDEIERTELPLTLLDRLSDQLRIGKKGLKRELERRQRILEWALEANVRGEDFLSVVNTYYVHPERVGEMIS